MTPSSIHPCLPDVLYHLTVGRRGAASRPGLFTDPTQTQLASLLEDQSLSNLYACLSQPLLRLRVNPEDPPRV